MTGMWIVLVTVFDAARLGAPPAELTRGGAFVVACGAAGALLPVPCVPSVSTVSSVSSVSSVSPERHHERAGEGTRQHQRAGR